MTRPRSFRRLALVVLAAVVPLTAACSGSGTPTTTGSSSVTTTTAAGASSTPPTTPSTASTASPGPVGTDAAYCDALKTGQAELTKISGSISDQAALTQGLAVINKIREAAPDEVKAAWGDFAAFVETAAAGNTSALTSAMAKMSAATTTIAEHAKKTCAINLQ